MKEPQSIRPHWFAKPKIAADAPDTDDLLLLRSSAPAQSDCETVAKALWVVGQFEPGR